MENLKLYNGVLKLSSFILTKTHNIEVIGYENINPDKNYLITSNHKTAIDPLFILYALNKKEIVHFMAKKEPFENKIAKWFLESVGAFPVDRENLDLKAVKQAVKYLKDNQFVAIFPEGTRNHENDSTIPFHNGAFKIAKMGKTEILPCALIIEKRNVKIIIGESFDPKTITKDQEDSILRDKTNTLIKENRGVYND